jgi:hydrogenase expression/formation protein HypD
MKKKVVGSKLTDSDLFEGFKDPRIVKLLQSEIQKEAANLKENLYIMEVCGGHTHTIMKYGLNQLLPESVRFIHGPGCPVCVMPKERVDHAYALSLQKDVILVTLGDMVKVPGSYGSLQNARADGADVRFVYSPLDTIKIAKENSDKKIIFFAIGFETTTPMTAALVKHVIDNNIKNIYFHINHITVPEPMRALLDSGEAKISAFIGPSHVSVITGSKIYEEIPSKYSKPVVVAGFEPVDVMKAVLMIIKQINEDRCELEIEYTRSVTYEGNIAAQKLNDRFFEKRESFRWRGIGDIPNSALKLKDEFKDIDAEVVFKEILPSELIDDHKLCICGDILKGIAKPDQCKVFGTACKPSSPMGSCMVSSEGACSAYYKYGNFLK